MANAVFESDFAGVGGQTCRVMSSAQKRAPGSPERGYLLCASPRSGSTLLCDLLAQTDCAGRPQSYFRPEAIPELARGWGLSVEMPSWDRAYVESVVEHGTAGTGCFGMRIMWSDMNAFLARLRHLYPGTGSDVDMLRHVFGVERFVHLSRGDRVAEAVSLVLAKQTGLWHRHADGSERERSAPPASPRYDHDEIDAALCLLDAEAIGWTTWFHECEVVPLAVSYEELAANPGNTLRGVIEFIGGCATIPVETRTSRLATSVNAEWSARFRREHKAMRSFRSRSHRRGTIALPPASK